MIRSPQLDGQDSLLGVLVVLGWMDRIPMLNGEEFLVGWSGLFS